MFILCFCLTAFVACQMYEGKMEGTASRYLLGGLTAVTLFFLSDIASLFASKDVEQLLQMVFLAIAIFFSLKIVGEFRLYLKRRKRKREFAKLKARREREEAWRKSYDWAERYEKVLRMEHYGDRNDRHSA